MAIYHAVMTKIAIELGHRHREFPIMVIFASYVQLPEGNEYLEHCVDLEQVLLNQIDLSQNKSIFGN